MTRAEKLTNPATSPPLIFHIGKTLPFEFGKNFLEFLVGSKQF